MIARRCGLIAGLLLVVACASVPQPAFQPPAFIGKLIQKAEGGDLVSATRLYSNYQIGYFVEPDPDQARHWKSTADQYLRQMREAGLSASDVPVLAYYANAIDRSDPDKAALIRTEADSILVASAMDGDAVALMLITEHYGGRSPPITSNFELSNDRRNLARAGLTPLADAGNAEATYALARLAAMPEDRYRLHLRAAELGHVDAMLEVSRYLGPRDRETSAYWLGKAAAAGNARAMHELAIYYNGRAENNPQAELAWQYRAAESGDPTSSLLIARRYLNGDGVVQDADEAIRRYLLLAEQGDARAMDELVRAYDRLGQPKKAERWRYWMRKVAPLTQDSVM